MNRIIIFLLLGTAIKLRQQHLAFTKIDVLSDGRNIAEQSSFFLNKWK